jgi:branched-subunit amino acid transport protein
MNMWIVMAAVGAGSFVFRLGPQLLFERVSLSARADRVIRQAGIAAITALIVVSTKQTATGHATVPALLAVAIATVLGARGGSILRLLAAGGAVYVVATLAVDLVAR